MNKITTQIDYEPQRFNHKTKFEVGGAYILDTYQRAYVKDRYGCLPNEPFTCIEAPNHTETQEFFSNMKCFFDSDDLRDKREVVFNSPLDRYNDRETRLRAFSIPLESLKHCFQARENCRIASLKAFDAEDKKPKRKPKAKSRVKKQALDVNILKSLGWA